MAANLALGFASKWVAAIFPATLCLDKGLDKHRFLRSCKRCLGCDSLTSL